MSCSGTMDCKGEDVNEDLDQVSHICCFGATYDGILSMAVMAQNLPEITFKIVDRDQGLITKWKGGEILFYEPEFEELINAVRGKNLFFCEEMEAAIKEARIVFVAVDVVPVGPGSSLDLTDWEFAIRKIMKASTTRKIIVEKSMPYNPRDWTEEMVRFQNPLGLKFSVLSNPDFISQGTAVRDLRDPKRVVIARNHGHEEDVLMLQELYFRYVPVERILIVADHKTAEMGKLLSSVYTAMMHTGNVIANICESIGADSSDIRRIIGCADSENYMHASIGFGGPVIQDILYLKSVLPLHPTDCIRPDRFSSGLKLEADMLNQIIKLNEEKKKRLVDLMLNEMFSLTGKTIAVFGFSYKKDTDDIRDSPAIYICRALLEEGCEVRIFDPRVNENKIRSSFDSKVKKNKLRNRLPKTLSSKLSVCTTMPEAWSKAHAVVFLVNCDEFQQIDFEAMYREMQGWPYMFVGCKSGLDYSRIKTLGFELYVDGRQFVG